MVTRYLKEALANELRDMAGIDERELESLKKAWQKDLKTLDALLDNNMQVEMTEDEGHMPTFVVRKDGEVVCRKSENRQYIVDNLLEKGSV